MSSTLELELVMERASFHIYLLMHGRHILREDLKNEYDKDDPTSLVKKLIHDKRWRDIDGYAISTEAILQSHSGYEIRRIFPPTSHVYINPKEYRHLRLEETKLFAETRAADPTNILGEVRGRSGNSYLVRTGDTIVDLNENSYTIFISSEEIIKRMLS